MRRATSALCVSSSSTPHRSSAPVSAMIAVSASPWCWRRERHALLLAVRQLGRIVVLLGLESDLFEGEEHPRDDLVVAEQAGDADRERHVLEHGPIAEQPEIFVDDAERAAQQGALTPAQAG